MRYLNLHFTYLLYLLALFVTSVNVTKIAIKILQDKAQLHKPNNKVRKCCNCRLCDCMWDSFDPRERTICGIAMVTGGRGAVA